MPTVCSNGIELAYEARGEGEPLVLVSGIGMQMVVWPEGFVGGLVARGFRVVVFDNRDVGMSTKLAALGVPPVRRLLARRILGLSVAAPYTLFDMASDVAGLLDALGIERAHVVGASLGGMVAQAMAIAHGGRMKSLVSMMSHPNRRLLTAGLPHATLRLLKHPGRTRAEVVANQVAFFRTAGSTRFDRDERALAERLGRAYDRSHDPRGFARQLAAVLATGDLTGRLGGVRVPTLVLHGSVDPIFRPAAARETADAVPGAQLRIVEGWGHDLAEGVWPVLVDAIASFAGRNRG